MRIAGQMAALAAASLAAACGQGGDGAGAAQNRTTAAAAATIPARDWNAVVAATPEGGFRIGNPDAPVKFVEFASLTCPHCADFHKAAMPSLRRDYIATGRVSYELRNFVLNGTDLAVTVLARCQGPAPFFRLVDALYAEQPTWLQPFVALKPADYERIGREPRGRQMVAMADAGNMDDFMRLRGMPRARFEACLTDPKAVDALERIRGDAVQRYDLQGTPTFVINGAKSDARDWAGVEAALKDALG